MKKISLLLFLSLLSGKNIFSQTATWTSAVCGDSTEETFLTGICSDKFGNIYASGNFSSQYLTLGSVTLTNQNYNPYNNGADIFIVKYDQAWQVIWAKDITGYYIGASGLSCDSLGNVFISGVFQDEIDLDTLTLIGPSSVGQIFLAKFDVNGTVQWGRSTGSPKELRSSGIACDPNGNVSWSGYFQGDSLIFSPAVIYNSQLNCGYGNCFDVYIVKYDASGDLMWAKSGGGPEGDIPQPICCDPFGNTYIAGYYSNGPPVFGQITLPTHTPIKNHIFFVKYDAAGNVVWARTDDSSEGLYAKGLASDASGNIFLAGVNGDIMHFDTVTVNYTGYNCWGDNPCWHSYIVKFNSSGQACWAWEATGNAYDVCEAVGCDALGNVYISGNFSETSITIGNISANNYDPWSGSDVFLAKLTSAGVPVWIKDAGGSDTERGFSIAANGTQIFCGGNFESQTIHFDSLILHNVWTNDINFFIAKVE